MVPWIITNGPSFLHYTSNMHTIHTTFIINSTVAPPSELSIRFKEEESALSSRECNIQQITEQQWEHFLPVVGLSVTFSSSQTTAECSLERNLGIKRQSSRLNCEYLTPTNYLLLFILLLKEKIFMQLNTIVSSTLHSSNKALMLHTKLECS